jgi:hypothetical protein
MRCSKPIFKVFGLSFLYKKYILYKFFCFKKKVLGVLKIHKLFSDLFDQYEKVKLIESFFSLILNFFIDSNETGVKR